MPNKKSSPATGKTAAGKTNSKVNKGLSEKEKAKQKIRAEKDAKRLREERLKKQKQREKRSLKIQKQRAAEKKRAEKLQADSDKRDVKKSKRRKKLNVFKRVWKKIKYYTGKEFLSSFNYVRILIFIVVPIFILSFGAVKLSQTVFLNVPSAIINTEFNGRLENSASARKSEFNSQQIDVFTEAIKSKGSSKFSFYVNSEIHIDDSLRSVDLCLGSPEDNDYILIATIYDGKDVVYRSLGIEPGTEINEATLFKELPYGTHKLKIAVNAYDRETNEKIGTRYAKIKLLVGVE